MTIEIRKHSKGRAIVTVDGRTYDATYAAGQPGWRVVTDRGPMFSRGGKAKGIAAIFIMLAGIPASAATVTINGRPMQAKTTGSPKPNRPRVRRGGPAFSTPAPASAHAQTLSALVHLEAALVARASERGVTPELEKSFERYQKLKALALATSNPTASPAQKDAQQLEAIAALRASLIEAVKLVF